MRRARAKTPRGRVLPPLAVLGGVLVALLAVWGMAALVELLRPPATLQSGAPPQVGGHVADPRKAPSCEGPAAREGRPRVPGAARGLVEVTSRDLLDCPESYDGQLVRYRGEVVGAVLQRRTGAWVQLNDDVYAERIGPLPAHRTFAGTNSGVGAFLPLGVAAQIGTVGGPRTRGDVLEVVAVFHRVDELSTEAVVLRVVEGRVVRPGERSADTPLRDRRVVAGVLAPLALAVLLAERLVARRR